MGFEPTLEFPLNTLSKRAPSATRPSLRVSRWAGTNTAARFTAKAFHAVIVTSILWVCLRNPQLEERKIVDSDQEILLLKSVLEVEVDAAEDPDPDAPAAAAFAAPPLIEAEAGIGGTFVLSTI